MLEMLRSSIIEYVTRYSNCIYKKKKSDLNLL